MGVAVFLKWGRGLGLWFGVVGATLLLSHTMAGVQRAVPWVGGKGRTEASRGLGRGLVVVVVVGVLEAAVEVVVAVVVAAWASWARGVPLWFSLWSSLGLSLAFAHM